ncbi:MAG: DUF4249 domain-containing protein [Candidatus Eisenbacteria bacterium]|nr:DUF4249 domain-containing protein [Candidatus Eisenbacteria bacterium]
MSRAALMLRAALVAASAAAISLLSGCESAPTEARDYDPEPVLTAYLMRGEPVREVYLQRVAPLQGFYLPGDHGITGADVLVRSIGGADSLTFHDDPEERGHYLPDDTTWVPRGAIRYRIEARFDDDLLWAETVVPGAFDLEVLPTPVAGDTLTRDDANILLQWSTSDSAGGYTFSIMSLADEDSLIHLDPDYEPDPEDAGEDSLARSAGWMMREDQRTLTIPWIIFNWAGPYRVSVMAVTSEYYEYAFAWMRIASGAEMTPPTNIHGGLGIFAGLSRHQFEFYMKPVAG